MNQLISTKSGSYQPTYYCIWQSLPNTLFLLIFLLYLAILAEYIEFIDILSFFLSSAQTFAIQLLLEFLTD
jgi:hypothetical protein